MAGSRAGGQNGLARAAAAARTAAARAMRLVARAREAAARAARAAAARAAAAKARAAAEAAGGGFDSGGGGGAGAGANGGGGGGGGPKPRSRPRRLPRRRGRDARREYPKSPWRGSLRRGWIACMVGCVKFACVRIAGPGGTGSCELWCSTVTEHTRQSLKTHHKQTDRDGPGVYRRCSANAPCLQDTGGRLSANARRYSSEFLGYSTLYP